MNSQLNDVYKGKKVLITGHTGFKGSWLLIWLDKLGANVIGYSLPEWDNDYIFKNSKSRLNSVIDIRGDITDLNKLKKVFEEHRPEIVFHLAAQPIVRTSFVDPVNTLKTNIIGTVNILECIKIFDFVKAGVIITTDKCYKNKEQEQGYKETDELGGSDPYSASKACAEIIINSYRKSFFNHSNKLVASARAGNVIGGGDWSKDRLIPDCIRRLKQNNPIEIRNPSAVRPWQHVLECNYGYLLLGVKLLQNKNKFAEAWNFGPDKEAIVQVNKIADFAIQYWGSGQWIDKSDPNEKMKETKLLSLDNTKSKNLLNWYNKFNIEQTMKKTAEWYKRSENEEVYNLCIEQIEDYENINQ